MSKQIFVENSPWGRKRERPSDCQRWIQQGNAFISNGKLVFTKHFCDALLRQQIETDPFGFDDGTLRRWCNSPSGKADESLVIFSDDDADKGEFVSVKALSAGGIGTKQLLPVRLVGTARGVTSNPDKLKRRQRRVRTLNA